MADFSLQGNAPFTCLPAPGASTRFLDDVEHELRTPLAALMLVGENALVSLPPGSHGREAIESMLEEARHMRELLVQLLVLSRCSTVAAEPQSTVSDACELARSCVESLSLVAQAKGHELSASLHGPLPVRGSRALLRQAVINLVNNAIEHCPEGSCIFISACIDRLGRAAISVEDDGFGIAPEHQQRIFRRFDRGDASCRSGGGRGLGLSNALLIARCHGGTIELVSAPGCGARFTLRLPVVMPSAEIPRESVAAVA